MNKIFEELTADEVRLQTAACVFISNYTSVAARLSILDMLSTWEFHPLIARYRPAKWDDMTMRKRCQYLQPLQEHLQRGLVIPKSPLDGHTAGPNGALNDWCRA